jgi:hypothetical protein
VSAQAQALVGFWIQRVQVKGKLQLPADCKKNGLLIKAKTAVSL